MAEASGTLARYVERPGLSSRGWRLIALASGAVVESGFIGVLLAATSPLRAVIAAIALPVGVAITLSPHLGLYVVAATLIGTWPGQRIKLLGVFVVAAALAWLLRHRKALVPRNPILWLVTLYTLLVLASTISPRTDFAIWKSALTYVSYLSLVWLFVMLVDSQRVLRIVVWTCIGAGIFTAAFGVVQAYTHYIWPASTLAASLLLEVNKGVPPIVLQGWEGRFRIDSITGTPDFLPLYLQTLMPFVFFWMVRERGLWKRLFGILVLALFMVAHFLSFTRGALFTTLLVILIMIWMVDRRRFMAYVPLATVLGSAALMSWDPMRARVIALITRRAPPGMDILFETGDWRIRTFPIALRMMFEDPILGMGIGQQRYNWPASAWHLVPIGTWSLSPVHNTYLLTGIELGLGGLLLLLLLLAVTSYRLHWLGVKLDSLGELELAGTAKACLVALIGLAAAMMFYPMLDEFRYFWLLIGLAAAMWHYERLVDQADPPRRSPADSAPATAMLQVDESSPL